MLKDSIAYFALWLTLVACTIGNYDTGDSSYSYLKAEMVNMHTMAANRVDYAIVDGGKRLELDPHYMCSWTKKADTTYRAMLYYHEIDNKAKAEVGLPVLVLRPIVTTKAFPADPVKVESAWLSEDKRYLNLRLGLLTGKIEVGNPVQNIGVVQQKIETNTQGNRLVRLRLLHAQNQVPQYYTSTVYASVPLTQYHQGDTIHLSINTYQGEIERLFAW